MMLYQKVIDDMYRTSGEQRLKSSTLKTYGILRSILSIPMIITYGLSFAVLTPVYKNAFQVQIEDMNRRIVEEKHNITTPIALPTDLFTYGTFWQDMSGEDPLVHTLMTEGLENLFKSLNFLKDIQHTDDDMDETNIKQKLRAKLNEQFPNLSNELKEQKVRELYESITKNGGYCLHLFDQLFSLHKLNRLNVTYTDTDASTFFNYLCMSPNEIKFRQILGAYILNAPYYLVIKNSINEYYQNSDILIPVDLFSSVLFMMYLDEVKHNEARPTIEECRRWVFSVIVPDEATRKQLLSRPFTVQQIDREEMIMPNPGYCSNFYDKKKHNSFDFAVLQGTMIRAPISGTVNYVDDSPKKGKRGNIVVLSDERSKYIITIYHIDDKEYIKKHSVNGELATPIKMLQPHRPHLVTRGQFFEYVGNYGENNTGPHTHVQIALKADQGITYDFLAVNKPFEKKFRKYLELEGYWSVYSKNEDLIQFITGIAASRYDCTRHFADRDPGTLAIYRQLQQSFVPSFTSIIPGDLILETVPEKLVRTYYSRSIQEKLIMTRYQEQLKYYKLLNMKLKQLIQLEVPLAPGTPEKTIPLTPWLSSSRRRKGEEAEDLIGTEKDRAFYTALNKYFMYKILQIQGTPRELTDHFLSGTAVFDTAADIEGLPEERPSPPLYKRIDALELYAQQVTGKTVSLSELRRTDICEPFFKALCTLCKEAGMPLDAHFGFYRYDMDELQNTYMHSKFVRFPDERQFSYDIRYEETIRSFIVDLLELSAEHGNKELFHDLFRSVPDAPTPLLKKGFQGLYTYMLKRPLVFLGNSVLRAYRQVRGSEQHDVLPVQDEEANRPGFSSTLLERIRNIIRPISFQERTYAENTHYRASETALFYSFIYEIYRSERERYMALLPLEQCTNILEGIGLFDNVYKGFCENAVQYRLIDNAQALTAQKLEEAQHELERIKQLKVQLLLDRKKKQDDLALLGESIKKQANAFSELFMDEEKKEREFNEKIAHLEHTIMTHQHEIEALTQEKEHIKRERQELLDGARKEIEELKDNNTRDHDRFEMELRNITERSSKNAQEMTETKEQLLTLQKELTELGTDLEEKKTLLLRYRKRYTQQEQKISSQEERIKALEQELSLIQNDLALFTGDVRTLLGAYANDMTQELLLQELTAVFSASENVQNPRHVIAYLKNQQKNDRFSLSINSTLIAELKDRVAQLEVQLEYLLKTKTSDREKELMIENHQLEEENKKLRAAVNGQQKSTEILYLVKDKSR